VYQARDKRTDVVVAMKVAPIAELEDLMNEIGVYLFMHLFVY
jgi:hypothetical protein